MRALLEDVGVVAIGRNEGDRLVRCLSARGLQGIDTIVYVDSGSTDDSLRAAERLGAHCVELDMSLPFTAARARNAGLARLLERQPNVRFVQFVDGDCELTDGWLETAARYLREHPTAAAVCGRLKERFPDASLYNRLCDISWDGSIGEIEACGGNAMHRATAFQQIGGFSPDLIAGEEGELCLRLRRKGWKIQRLGADMALHDSEMMRFTQWWTRSVRTGFVYAEGAYRYGKGPEQYRVRETRRVWFWGLLLPATALGAAVPTLGLSLGLLGAYPLSIARAYARERQKGRKPADALSYSAFNLVGKLPELQGALQFHANRFRGRSQELIEYRSGT